MSPPPGSAVLDLETRAGIWLGNFRSHLASAGATWRPPPSISRCAFPWSVGWVWKASSGTTASSIPSPLRLIGLFSTKALDSTRSSAVSSLPLRLGMSVGCEQGSSLVTIYSMGYWEASIGLTWRLNSRASWSSSVRFRTGIFFSRHHSNNLWHEAHRHTDEREPDNWNHLRLPRHCGRARTHGKDRTAQETWNKPALEDCPLKFLVLIFVIVKSFHLVQGCSLSPRRRPWRRWDGGNRPRR